MIGVVADGGLLPEASWKLAGSVAETVFMVSAQHFALHVGEVARMETAKTGTGFRHRGDASRLHCRAEHEAGHEANKQHVGALTVAFSFK